MADVARHQSYVLGVLNDLELVASRIAESRDDATPELLLWTARELDATGLKLPVLCLCPEP
jgi:hypothetical protein